MRPTAGSANVEVAEPGPSDVAEADRGQDLVDEPVRDSSQPQMIPAATSGMTCGRNRTVRDTVPSRPVATRWMTLAVDQAQGDRDEAEEDDEPERVEERLDELRLARGPPRSSPRPTHVDGPTPSQR